MTIEEIKAGISQCTLEERSYLAAFPKHLARKDDPEYILKLTRLNDEIDAQGKIHLGQVKAMHEVLKSR